jgi:hypothetical protein
MGSEVDVFRLERPGGGLHKLGDHLPLRRLPVLLPLCVHLRQRARGCLKEAGGWPGQIADLMST